MIFKIVLFVKLKENTLTSHKLFTIIPLCKSKGMESLVKALKGRVCKK